MTSSLPLLALLGPGCSRIDAHSVLAVPVGPAGSSVPAPTVPAGEGTRRDPRFTPAVAVLEQEMATNRGVGVSIAVYEQGALTWVEGFGSADSFDTTGAHPVTPTTTFQIGGISAQLTAAMALVQEQRGLYSLDDPMAELLPSFELAYDGAWSGEARLRALLAQRGGLYDYLDWGASPADADLADWHYGFYADEGWTLAPPGLFYNPSTLNYSLAGLVVEERDPAGRYFADVIEHDLFAPLGMTHTFASKASAERDGNYALSTGIGNVDAFGYTDIPMDQVADPAYARPGLLAWSTPSDLCAWGAFLMHGDDKVLDGARRGALTASSGSTLEYDEHLEYGLGIELWDEYPLQDGFHELRVWRATGTTRSFTTHLLILPDEDVVIALASNGYADTFDTTLEVVLRAVVERLPPSSGYAPELEPGSLADHVGVYVDAANVGPIFVTEGGATGLQIAMPWLASEGYSVEPDLVPVSTDRWNVEIEHVPFDLTFVRVPDGRPTYLRNHLFVGTRSDLLGADAPPGTLPDTN